MKLLFRSFRLLWPFLVLISPSLNGGEGTAFDLQVDRFKRQFESATVSNIRAIAEEFSYSGIQDPALFDVMRVKLSELLPDSRKNDENIEMASWLVKTLAMAGAQQDEALLRKIVASKTSHKKLKKHSETAITRLKDYARWNPVISRNLRSATNDKELARMKVSNMLTSKYPELIRVGAKTVYRHYKTEERLQDEVETVLRNSYPTNKRNYGDTVLAGGDIKVIGDAMAWLCKSLAESGDLKYRPTLNEVAQSTTDKKLQKYAAKYAKAL